MQTCNIDKLNFIAIDFETATTFGNSACSVRLVRYIDGKEAGGISSLIRPAKMYFIPEWTETIHHISYDDVRDKPFFPEVWQTIVQPFLFSTSVNNIPSLETVIHYYIYIITFSTVFSIYCLLFCLVAKPLLLKYCAQTTVNEMYFYLMSISQN